MARKIIGRGTDQNPTNRFELLSTEDDFEHLEGLDPSEFEPRKIRTEHYVDQSQTLVTKNDSPDIPFTYSINPYRGCSHGCTYWYGPPSSPPPECRFWGVRFSIRFLHDRQRSWFFESCVGLDSDC